MESIAIIGMGCRFPGATNPESFWELLRDGKDAIAQVPQDRWNVDEFYHPHPDTPGKMNTCRGGFLNNVDQFDAEFFGMSADETEHTDPQQRLFLEVAWEALENAGIAPTTLRGSQTGVFIGLCTIDYHRLLYRDFDRISCHSGIGTTPCITANRLSYCLDLHGPSMAVDAACSSSLVTVHLACQSLRSGESDLCLAGGVNLILSPDSTISSARTRMLSPSGICKTFDAQADGYVRGEGCGVVVLKRLSDALRDGDSILALIRGSAVNQDGLSSSISAPNGRAQEAVIRQAIKNAQVQPTDIDYVDAHAVGTALGDAVEFQAIKNVLSANRSLNQRCWVGSVKPNIGHLEAAAGMSALIKVVLALQHEKIPPHLHLKQLNPYISLKNTPFSIPTEPVPWTRGEKSRLASVSAFGFGGTNGYVIVEEAPVSRPMTMIQTEDSPYLFTLSAKCDRALKELAQRYATFLSDSPDVSLRDVCLTTNQGRSHFSHRLGIVSNSISQLRQQLQQWLTNHDGEGVFQGEVKGRKRPKIAFLFPHENPHDRKLASIGFFREKVFGEAFTRCVDSFPSNQEMPLFNQFAMQYAIAKLWQSWGISPKAFIGYGIGEYVAATVGEAIALPEALHLAIAQNSALSSEEIHALKETWQETPISLLSGNTGKPISLEMLISPSLKEPEENALREIFSDYNFILVIGENFPTFVQEGQTWLYSSPPEILPILAHLYTQGIAINWENWGQNYSHLQLPTYPFQRKRYWFKQIECDDLTKVP